MTTDPYRILVTGSRAWDDFDAIVSALLRVVRAEADRRGDTGPTSWVTVVHGACPTGADQLAGAFARDVCGWSVEEHPANWGDLGRAAGPLRNQHMVDLGADMCLAFVRPESRGTKDCLQRAIEAGIPTMVFDYGEQRCEDCGCTDRYGCPQGCWWVSQNQCSSCTRRRIEALA